MSDKQIRNSKIFMYISIAVFVICFSFSTYAVIQKLLFDDLEIDSYVNELAYYIRYTNGNSITNGTLVPSSDYSGGLNASVQFYKKDESYNIYGHIYLDVTTIGNGIGEDPGFKYTIVNSMGEKVIEDTLFAKSGFSVPLAINVSLLPTPETYTVYIWIDENAIGNYELQGETLSATIRCEATMKPIEFGKAGYALTLISNKFNFTNTVTNNSINYDVDSDNKLIKDNGDNIRYYGANPNNYIYFNCETYPDTNCEIWRIIGIVDGKIKIMRGSNIGSFIWDTSENTTAGNTGYGINQWGETTYTDETPYNGADLMKLLNPGYDNNQDLDASGNTITVNNSLYYNADSGTCYSGRSNATTACNFTSTGIKNTATRNKIAVATFYTGASDNMQVYPNVALTRERGSGVGPNTNDNVVRKNTWNGRVALPSASDYGYAADLSLCVNKNLSQYSNSGCTTNNWMYKIITNNGAANTGGHLLNPDSAKANSLWYIQPSGYIYGWGTNIATANKYIVPVLYLSSNAIIQYGSGTQTNPYRLSA